MKSIFSFTDFREYLKAYYLNKKVQSKSFTYKKFSEKANIVSPNYLKLIIDGKKKLSLSDLYKFAQALNLNYSEHQYFEALVYLGQSESSQQKKYYKARLREIKKHTVTNKKRFTKKSLLKEWYYPAVLLSANNCSEGQLIKNTISLTGLSKTQIQEAIDFFVTEELIKLEKGVYQLVYENIVFWDEQSLDADFKNFQALQLDLSKKYLKKHYGKNAKFVAQSFTVSKEGFKHISNKYESFLDEISQFSDEEPAEQLVQINSQIFSLTR